MMPIENMYKQGMRVWIPHQNKVWESAIILEGYDADQNKLFICLDESRDTKILNIKCSAELPPLNLTKDSSLDVKSNLSSLTVIHEATILQQLRSRFEQRHCYSYCGVSTVALNPYFQLSENETDIIWNYRNSRNLDPHIFGVTGNVYRKLERENRDQTIVFTGQSGAGKTVNAERAILFLTTVSSKNDQVREKILASSVVLQAFGHATTAINNDSSRFGKFVQMQYDKHYRIIGALLTTYNLDRSKIILQGHLGSIFNIFYYMYAGKENLSHLLIDKFDNLRKKTDTEAYNKKYFDETIKAFNVLEITEKKQNEIFKILAVVLHLQSLALEKTKGREINESTESCTVADPDGLKALGNVLGLDEPASNNLRKWMCYKRTFCDQDEILQPMRLDQAIKARGALAKFMYTKLFNWLLTRINASFRSPCHVQSFIGILDMQGFEKLDSNLFEQFCINYTVEKIEQMFIQSIFKLEQEEYLQEEIGWTPICFSDNISCVELIDGKFGIFNLLEEEIKMSCEENQPWLENLRTKFDKAQNFEKSASTLTEFTILHSTCPVKYNATDFLAKNYKGVAKEQLEALKDIKNELLSTFIMDELSKLNVSKIKKKINVRRSSFNFKTSKKTVTTELQTSLTALLSTLSESKKHFVKCIKSNDEKKPLTFDALHVVEQLRAYNVCETIKISAAGYFQQRCYREFFQRYHCLCKFEDVKLEDKQVVCRKILALHGKNDNVKFGKTKVFLREDTADSLEILRAEKRERAAIVIQTSARRFLQQKSYNEIRRLIYGIQRYARGYLVRQRMQTIHDRLVQDHAATMIQACFRGYLEYRRFQYMKHMSPVPQAPETPENEIRQHLRLFNSEDQAATEIQRHVKRFLARRQYESTLRKIIIVQSFVRRFLAIMMLKRLKHHHNLRTSLLSKSVERNLDFLQERINFLVNMHLTPEDMQAVNSIVDNQTCVQTKNRILNQLLFKKIKNLQDLRTNEKHCEDSQINQPDVAASANHNIKWRSFDTPMVEQSDNKELYQKLYDAFQKVDRDAKTLQQTAGIADADILKLMESYRNSSKSVRIPVIIIENVEQIKHHNKNVKESKTPIPERADHRIYRKKHQQVQNINSMDLQALNPYPFLKLNTKPEDESLDIDKECQQRVAKKEDRLKLLIFDEDESPEEIDVKMQASNQPKPPKIENLQVSRLNPKDHRIPEQICQARKRFRLLFFGDESEGAFTRHVAYDGLFEFPLRDTAIIVRQITDISPTTFTEYDLSADLPAQILMMCIRYADYRNDYLAALSLVCNFIQRVRNIVDANDVFDVRVFWFSNTYKLLNYVKQYSKEEDGNYQFHAFNTTRQNHQRLQNFDIRDVWTSLEQTCRHIARWIVKGMRTCNVALYSVCALLRSESVYTKGSSQKKEDEENEEGKARGKEKEKGKEAVKEKEDNKEDGKEKKEEHEEQVGRIKPTVDILLNELTTYYYCLIKYAVDRQAVIQIFAPVFDYINSVTLSNILYHSQLCSVSKSIQIRYSLTALEHWVTDRKLTPLILILNPVVQAVRVIQCQPMSQINFFYIDENYNELSYSQILRLIELYNANCASKMPANHEQVMASPYIIKRLKEEIKHDDDDLNSTVLSNLNGYSIKLPFRHSKVKLEQVEIPQVMNLPMLKKM